MSIPPTALQKWQLLSAEDASPSPHFPIEKRTYRRPDGAVVNDFYVTTIADSVHIIPITADGKFILIRQYKQGVDRIVTQFPAGRVESKHVSLIEAARAELEEETGISVPAERLEFIGKHAVMTTKSTEFCQVYVARDVEFNAQQILDDNEEIEVIEATTDEVDELIASGEMAEGLMIANWYLVKKWAPELF